MRDNKYLEENLYDLWENHFCDIPRKNLVVIKFGKYSKRQLGSIKTANGRSKIKTIIKKKEHDLEIQDIKSITIITITKYFEDESIPDFVVRSTIAHELCHYAHGFHSPLQKQFQKPHQGHVIDRELKNRGLIKDQLLADEWLKKYWLKQILLRNFFFKKS